MVFIPIADRRPHVFLCHSTQDKPFVIQLANDLNVCEVDVWLDEWEMEAGDSLFDTIHNGINASHFVAIVLSKNFMKSKWGSKELRAAFAKEIEADDKIILPIVLDDVEIPLAFKDKINLSFQNDYYPSLTKLAGIIHKIPPKEISQAVHYYKPQSITAVVDTLAYCGKDPYMIIPEDVFQELAKTDIVEVEGERLTFPFALIKKIEGLSERADHYLKRLQQGVLRDVRTREIR